MKKYILLLLFPCLASAQTSQIVEAVSGDDLSDKVSQQVQYVFPEFTDGDVYLMGQPKSTGKLNYNMLLGEMQFMDNNSVMALADVKNVFLVDIDNRKFYPFSGNEFTEELMTTATCNLRVRCVGSVTQHAKKGAYGMSSSTTSITSYNSINSDGQQFDLAVQETVLVTVRYYYYLVGTNGKYTLIKNVKTFTRQFPAYRAQIETFVNENNTQFDKVEDLKALLKYCSQLQ